MVVGVGIVGRKASQAACNSETRSAGRRQGRSSGDTRRSQRRSQQQQQQRLAHPTTDRRHRTAMPPMRTAAHPRQLERRSVSPRRGATVRQRAAEAQRTMRRANKGGGTIATSKSTCQSQPHTAAETTSHPSSRRSSSKVRLTVAAENLRVVLLPDGAARRAELAGGVALREREASNA